MKNYKDLQHLYHCTMQTTDYIDNNDIIYVSRQNLPERIIAYFNIEVTQLEYPAKSYAVAIIYAKLLEKYFDEDFYQALNDPDLLYNNDRFFVPYKEDQVMYDHVLSQISLNFNGWLPTQVHKTIKFFEKEFFIGQDIYNQVKNNK